MLKNREKCKKSQENLEDSLIADSLNSSRQVEPAPKSNFLSLIDAAITYFQQSAPINSSIFAIQKAEIESELKKSAVEQIELIDDYKSIKKNCEALKHQYYAYEKAIESLSSQQDDLNIITKQKELELKRIQFDILHLKKHHETSTGHRPRARRNTNDLRIDSNEDQRAIKFSEGSEDSNPQINLIHDYRFNTYH